MTMLEFYYTSCSRGTSGGTGFQYKALSQGISSADVTVMNSIIGFRIPPSLLDRPISEHPPALRYEYLSADKCILVCSQSNGSDENGRPGNFFAHGIITSPVDFDLFPAIMFWRHPFWKLRDDSPSLELPVQPAFDLQPSLEFEDLWSFLNVGNRRQAFMELLNAVLLFGQTKRPIVILDDVDNVALWILAVSVALPQIYRKFISFATYHHDPYQAPFLITGTTLDSRFRFSADEYISYFILNMQQDRVSDAPVSSYTHFACNNFTPALYESVLLDFFQLCNDLIPQADLVEMNDQLETVTYFYQTVRRKDLPVTDERAKKGINYFLSHIQNCQDSSESDIDDLIVIVDRLGREVADSYDLDTVDLYGIGLQLLKKFDRNFSGHAWNHLILLLDLIWKGNDKAVDLLFATYREIYQDAVLTQVISDPEYLIRVANPPSNQIDSQQLIWRYIAPYIIVGANSRELILKIIVNALKACDQLPSMNRNLPPLEADRLLDLMIHSNINVRLYFEAGIKGISSECGDAFLWLYYKIIRDLPFQKRKAYRSLMGPFANSIEIYEVICDVQTAGVKGGLQTLLNWLRAEEGNQKFQTQAVENGLDVLWSLANSNQKHYMAEDILKQPIFNPFLSYRWVASLLKEYINQTEFVRLNQIQIDLYERYSTDPSLDVFQRGIVGGSLAMSTGQFNDMTIVDIRKYLSKLNQSEYEKEIYKLMAKFFQNETYLEKHKDLVRSVYVHRYQDIFWRVYWHFMADLMLDSARMNDFVNVLSFWFNGDDSFSNKETPYLYQSFFLILKDMIISQSDKRGFDRAASAFHHMAKNQPWYYLVQDTFGVKQKKGFLGAIRK